MKVIIVGGVAGGASCAARLARLDESLRFSWFVARPVCVVRELRVALPRRRCDRERVKPFGCHGTDVSRVQFAIDCRTRCEVIGISSAQRTVELKNHVTGEVTTEHYDKLVLSPGAAPIRPPLPGIDLPGIFSVRTVPDAQHIREWLERGTADHAGMNSYTGYQTVTVAKRAVVVGGGFDRLADGGKPGPSRA